jgi:membrane protease YdiL (CAAX protease family)
MKFLERALDGQNQIWKFLVVLIVGFFGGQILGSMPLAITVAVQKAFHPGEAVLDPANPLNFANGNLSKNLIFFLLLLASAVTLAVIILLIRVVHKRTFAETVNGRRRVRRGRIALGAAVWIAMLAVYLIVDYAINPGNYVLQFAGWNFVVMVIIALLMIPLQTTSEEFFCRGYLAQETAAATRNRWLAILLPGLFFGLLHVANPEVKEFGFWLAMPQYIFFGLLFGLISVLDDGIELAIGMHTGNNLFLAICTTHASSALQTDALFEVQKIYPGRELATLVVTGLIALWIFAVRYKWDFGVLRRRVETN